MSAWLECANWDLPNLALSFAWNAPQKSFANRRQTNQLRPKWNTGGRFSNIFRNGEFISAVQDEFAKASRNNIEPDQKGFEAWLASKKCVARSLDPYFKFKWMGSVNWELPDKMLSFAWRKSTAFFSGQRHRLMKPKLKKFRLRRPDISMRKSSRALAEDKQFIRAMRKEFAKASRNKIKPDRKGFEIWLKLDANAWRRVTPWQIPDWIDSV